MIEFKDIIRICQNSFIVGYLSCLDEHDLPLSKKQLTASLNEYLSDNPILKTTKKEIKAYINGVLKK